VSTLTPTGTFEAVAVPVEAEGLKAYVHFGETSTGKYFASVRCRLMTGEAAGAEEVWTGYLTDSTIERTIKALRAFGFKGDDLSAAQDQELTNRVEVVIEHEEYKERTYARIRWVNDLGSRRFKALDRSKLRTLGGELRERVASVDAQAAQSSAPPPAPPVDDLPPF